MKAAVWFAPKDIRIVERDKPVPKPHEALVRIESVGICGSDLHYYAEGAIGGARLTTPTILGHEYAGTVEAVGESANPALLGKRVAVEPGIPCLTCEWCRTGHYNVCRNMFFPGGPGCDGAFCEYKTVHADFCFPVPETISAAEAAMIEPLAVAVHTVELGQLKPGETVAVLGLGPIGLMTAQVARLAGAEAIYGTDLQDYRVEIASQFGVDAAFNAATKETVDAILAFTNGRGVDVAFDAARSSDTLGYACRVARPAGRCVAVGISGTDSDPVPVSDARRKELCLQWCRRFCHDYPRTIALLGSGRLDVKPLITHSFSLDQINEAFELVYGFQDGVLKAAIDF